MTSSLTTLPDRLRAIRRDLREAYLDDHTMPWIIGFSAGKDSTLLLHLVVEAIETIAPDDRTRPVYVISNDTRVESPVFQRHVDRSLEKIERGLGASALPIHVVKTQAPDEESFWVCLLGKGYPAPNRSFRWCTDRLKIRTTSRFLKSIVEDNGEAILLLGVRRAESEARRQRIEKYDESSTDGERRLSPHNDISGCYIYRPIVDLTDEDVWHVLLNVRSPWGGDHRELVEVYRDARGGECPFVTSEEDAPGCGSRSARFGCWTCTVVEKDRSLEGLIDSGHDNLSPLSAFRERLKSVSADPNHRSPTRRNGQPGRGPLTIETRRMLLDELLELQQSVGMPLINDGEIRLIQDWWGRDAATAALRSATGEAGAEVPTSPASAATDRGRDAS